MSQDISEIWKGVSEFLAEHKTDIDSVIVIAEVEGEALHFVSGPLPNKVVLCAALRLVNHYLSDSRVSIEIDMGQKAAG